jgi:hypothetical protein
MLSLIGGCTLNSNTATATTNPTGVTTSNISSSPGLTPYMFSITGIEGSQNDIILRGTADLPDKSLLLSQLKKDGLPVSWWPAGQDINVANGQWLIMVAAGINGAPQPLPALIDDTYSLDIWQKDSPGSVSNLSMFFPRPLPTVP